MAPTPAPINSVYPADLATMDAAARLRAYLNSLCELSLRDEQARAVLQARCFMAAWLCDSLVSPDSGIPPTTEGIDTSELGLVLFLTRCAREPLECSCVRGAQRIRLIAWATRLLERQLD
jgi:hypothetical protein